MALSKAGALMKLINIGVYPQHLSCCTLSQEVQPMDATCDCGYDQASKDYQDLANYIIQSVPQESALAVINTRLTYTEVTCPKR